MGGASSSHFRVMPRYYTELGSGHDDILRCKDCRALVTSTDLFREGCCTECGCRRVTEVVGLSLWEWFKIRVKLIDFPHRKEFLNEFRRS